MVIKGIQPRTHYYKENEMSCNECNDYIWRLRYANEKIGELNLELYRHSTDLRSVISERDRLKKASDRSYDSYITSRCEGCSFVKELEEELEKLRLTWFEKLKRRFIK